jgi:hypothetical protein
MAETIAGIKIPDSRMAKDLTELIRDKEPDLLYHHSRCSRQATTRMAIERAIEGAKRKR